MIPEQHSDSPRHGADIITADRRIQLAGVGTSADEGSQPGTARMAGQRRASAFNTIFSFPAMLAVGLVVIAVLTVSHRFNDPDLWVHLKLGQVIWNSHSIPSTETFSFTTYGHPWIAHEWLAQLSIYAAYRFGGYSGLMLWLAFLASALLVLVYSLCYQHTRNALVAFLGGVCGWFFATVGLAIRPLMLGHIFLVLELILLEAGLRKPRSLWALPPLFAVWVNCHGSYFFGFGVLAMYCVCSFVSGTWGLVVADAVGGSTRKTLFAVMALSGVALFCNPIGVKLLAYPLDTLFHQPAGLNSVEEWLPPDLRSPRTLGMIGVVISVLLIPLLRHAGVRLRDLLLLTMAFGLALQHTRMLFLFGIIASPILCRVVAPMLSPGTEQQEHHPVLNAALIVAFLVVMLWGFPTYANIQQQVREGSPVAAVDYIRRARLVGPMLNEYVFGDYLIWALPEHKVFIDGRGDVYDWAGVFAEYGRWATLSEDPKRLLDRYHIRFCLLSSHSPLGQVIPYLGWRRTYSDGVATVFLRDEGE